MGLAVLGPLGVGALITALADELHLGAALAVGFIGTLLWIGLVFPYWFVVPPIVSPATGVFIAAAQWLFLAFVVAVVTRRFTLVVTIVTALITVIGAGAAVKLVLRALGHEIHFEMP